MKKFFTRRAIIILDFLLPIVIFLSVIFVFIYKNVLISNNKPNPKLQVFNKEGEAILEPSFNKILDSKRLRLKINYVYGEYYFNNEQFHHYFLKR